MYFQGSSEPDHGQLQTLHLMKPNYVTFSEDTQSHHQDNTDLLFNPTTINTSMAQQQQFVGFTSSLVHNQLQDQEDHVPASNIPRLYNHSMSGLAYQHGNQTNMAQSVSPQALSLSLSPHKINAEAFQKSNMNLSHTIIGQELHEKSTNFISSDHTLAAATGFSYPVQGVILSSKYLKAAQELLDEVASVGKDTNIIDEVKDKAKNVIIKHQSNDEAGAAVHELTTAQRQEMQMKKAKLNIMLDEVDQRCRQYHHQMQITISWFERQTGIGSSRSYTQLALKTILKQFKHLKSAIISQIKSINKSLGKEHNSGETFQQGSRLKFIDHQLRRSRSLQDNAWRPQRGLPEAAVSVLRAWLFEHFLHPYPKDSDKIMMAKQTGLTRGQVSNWFINARVRLWKPMVEEMYLEEMKNQEQANDHKDSSSSSDHDKNIKQSHQSHNQVVTTNPQQSMKDQCHENPTSNLVRSPTADISPSSVAISPSLLLPQLITTPLKFPEKNNNLKRPRNMIEKNQENSPSSILSSVEMEMKDRTTTMIRNNKGLYGIHRHDYLSTLNMNSDRHHVLSGFGNYGIGELSRFDTEQIQANNSQGNDSNNINNGNFSLSLALPPSSGNYHMSSHRNSFEFGIGGIDHQIGARVDDHGVMNNDDRSSHPSVGVNYEVLDFYNRSKRYASHQMLPDFVA